MCSIPFPALSPEHIHPILVNFTAALVPASVGSDIAGRVFRKASLENAAWWMLLYAAAITPLTACAGWWWKQRVSDTLPAELLLRHQRLGFSLAFAFIGLTVWRFATYRRHESPGFAYLFSGIVVVVLLVVQGALGGTMLFGS